MDHPKICELADGAFRLWVQGLAYCQKHLTDGRITMSALRGLRAYSPKRASALLASGLWEPTTDGVLVHDYLQWNDSRTHVLTQRELAKARMARLRGRSPEPTPNVRLQNERDPLHFTSLPTVPTHQEQTINPAEAALTRRRASDFDDGGFNAFWVVYPRKDAKKDAQRAWRQMKPNGATLQAILDDLVRRRNAGQWLDPQFTPLPASYLRGERWTDELRPSAAPMTKQTQQMAVATAAFLSHDDEPGPN